MSQPKNSIIEITEAAKKTQHLDDATLKLAHLEMWLEKAIETLVACEVVMVELERVNQQLEQDNRDLFQNTLDLQASLAISKRRLVVASQPTVETIYTFQYRDGGWKKDAPTTKAASIKRSHKKKS